MKLIRGRRPGGLKLLKGPSLKGNKRPRLGNKRPTFGNKRSRLGNKRQRLGNKMTLGKWVTNGEQKLGTSPILPCRIRRPYALPCRAAQFFFMWAFCFLLQKIGLLLPNNVLKPNCHCRTFVTS